MTYKNHNKQQNVYLAPEYVSAELAPEVGANGARIWKRFEGCGVASKSSRYSWILFAFCRFCSVGSIFVVVTRGPILAE